MIIINCDRIAFSFDLLLSKRPACSPAECVAEPRRTESPAGRQCLETIETVSALVIAPGVHVFLGPKLSANTEQIIFVFNGIGMLNVDGGSHLIGTGDLIHIAPGEEHELQNIGHSDLICLQVSVPVGNALVWAAKRSDSLGSAGQLLPTVVNTDELRVIDYSRLRSPSATTDTTRPNCQPIRLPRHEDH